MHLTLGQTRRLLGGMVAPAGACSSHRNPRREREGDVRCPLHLMRLEDVSRPLPESCTSCECMWERSEGKGQRGGKGVSYLETKGAMASFQLSSLSYMHVGISASLSHNFSLICDHIPRSILPEWGYVEVQSTGHSCIGSETERPRDTNVNTDRHKYKNKHKPQLH